MPEQTSAAPEGYTTVAPWVVTDDTGAFLDFVTEVFEGEELARVATESGAYIWWVVARRRPTSREAIANRRR